MDIYVYAKTWKLNGIFISQQKETLLTFIRCSKNVIIPGLKQKSRNYLHVDMQIQVLYEHTYLKNRNSHRSKKNTRVRFKTAITKPIREYCGLESRNSLFVCLFVYLIRFCHNTIGRMNTWIGLLFDHAIYYDSDAILRTIGSVVLGFSSLLKKIFSLFICKVL